MMFVHPDSKKKCLIKRTQIPLAPGFAMTAHKAQGKTMEAIVVDLESTSGTESPYVMLSRAKSLDGIFILRPFKQKTIQRHPSQDVRSEFRRLDLLSHQTTMKYGTADEAQEAQKYLISHFSSSALAADDEEMEEIFKDDDAHQPRHRLERLQADTSRLIGEDHRAARNPASETHHTLATTSRSSRRGHRVRHGTQMDVDNCYAGSTRAKRPRDESELTRRVRRNKDG
jgi:hypothetical protein